MATSQTNKTPQLARAAKAEVDDLFVPKPWIYWCDLLGSTGVTYSAIAIYVFADPFSILQLLAFLVAGIGLFRIATFMHEIVHMRKGRMRSFKLCWNILVGIPLLTPSLFYTTHADHHSNRYYGTPNDGEYLPFGATPPGAIVRFIATIPFVPLLAVSRAIVLVPISMVSPRLREWLLTSASAAVISPTYRRRNVPSNYDPLWLASDLACFVYVACVILLTIDGWISVNTLGMLYCVIIFAIGINWLRTLAAHRYRNTGREVSHAQQVLDSINIIGHPIMTECLYPVGLRYHALHHLLPSLPYHALGTAHRRLMEKLPHDSPYRLSSCPNTVAALRQLWRDAKASAATDGDTVKARWRQA